MEMNDNRNDQTMQMIMLHLSINMMLNAIRPTWCCVCPIGLRDIYTQWRWNISFTFLQVTGPSVTGHILTVCYLVLSCFLYHSIYLQWTWNIVFLLQGCVINDQVYYQILSEAIRELIIFPFKESILEPTEVISQAPMCMDTLQTVGGLLHSSKRIIYNLQTE